jgi:hypothetical protein
MFMSDWSAFVTPQKATLDSKRTLSCFVSYRRLSPQFQFSLSPAALDMYLYMVSSLRVPKMKRVCVLYDL